MKTLYPWRHRPSYRLGADMGSKSKSTAATRGIAYHRKVYRALEALLPADSADVELIVEPWFECVDGQVKRTMRQPDAVLRYPDNTAIVIEVKMNWRDGRDEKLLHEYLPIVTSAFKLDVVWPLMITQCLRGYEHPPLLGLKRFDECLAWQPGDPTPLLLHP
jgi:hypothetical protein